MNTERNICGQSGKLWTSLFIVISSIVWYKPLSYRCSSYNLSSSFHLVLALPSPWSSDFLSRREFLKTFQAWSTCTLFQNSRPDSWCQLKHEEGTIYTWNVQDSKQEFFDDVCCLKKQKKSKNKSCQLKYEKFPPITFSGLQVVTIPPRDNTA